MHFKWTLGGPSCIERTICRRKRTHAFAFDLCGGFELSEHQFRLAGGLRFVEDYLGVIAGRRNNRDTGRDQTGRKG